MRESARWKFYIFAFRYVSIFLSLNLFLLFFYRYHFAIKNHHDTVVLFIRNLAGIAPCFNIFLFQMECISILCLELCQIYSVNSKVNSNLRLTFGFRLMTFHTLFTHTPTYLRRYNSSVFIMV